ncbi:Tetratricopeptide TPR-1 [Macleaya cordata]|uniref:Tetratricopeptide TPR-1 n=1 Tax=Macleaya cordata TaxID=56857 RepID=A0A200Q8B0_MACCD|nr:Tetratricopeptide TPR-1 [Macleaya cordata]
MDPPLMTSRRVQILNAAITGKLNRLKKLSAKFDDGKGLASTIMSFKDDNGRGALHFAAVEGKLNVLKYLIDELKLDVDMKDGKGEAPLLHATIGGHLSTVAYLLEKGANPDTSNDSNSTPLHYAAEKGHLEILTLLLSRGVHIDALNNAGTPLNAAAAHGQHNAVKILLDHCANPNLFFHHVFTPLASSILSQSLRCVELLLEAGADPDAGSYGVTPLIVAASEGLTEMIKCLIEAGADPNLTNYYGLTPVEISAMHGNHKDVEILFPVTSRIPTYADWSIGGLMRQAHSEEAKEQVLNLYLTFERNLKAKEKFSEAKLSGTEAFRRKDYVKAIYWYTEASNIDPCDAAVLSNRSMCWAHMKEGDRALDDANACISLRPDWPKAYYRAGVALNILKRYGDAADAFFKGVKLDPENKELKDAFREAAEARLKSVSLK